MAYDVRTLCRTTFVRHVRHTVTYVRHRVARMTELSYVVILAYACCTLVVRSRTQKKSYVALGGSFVCVRLGSCVRHASVRRTINVRRASDMRTPGKSSSYHTTCMAF